MPLLLGAEIRKGEVLLLATVPTIVINAKEGHGELLSPGRAPPAHQHRASLAAGSSPGSDRLPPALSCVPGRSVSIST